MRLNHIVAALAVVACFSFASSALADGACCFLVDPVDRCWIATDAATCNPGHGSSNVFQGDGTNCCKTTCGNFSSAPARGACCTPNGCFIVLNATKCGLISGTYQGNDTRCTDKPATFGDICPSPVRFCPTLTGWGMVALLLVLLTAVTIKICGALPRRA